MPSTASVVTRKNSTLFIWYRGLHNLPWPQVIHDTEMFDYTVEARKLKVLQEHVLPETEVGLTITELMKLHPCVTHTEGET